jgi:hypothetical protein
MSAWTSQQAGNWSRSSEHADSPWYDNGAQSALASAPGSGDTFTISHDVVLDADATVGDGTDAGVVNNDATLTLNAKLTLAGDLVVGDITERDYHGELKLGPGSELTDDSNSREVQLCSAILSSTATSGNWATVSGTLGIRGVTTEGISSITRRYECDYVAFTTTGNLDFDAGSFGLLTTYIHFEHCTFVGCGNVEFGGGGITPDTATQETRYCDFRDCSTITVNGKDNQARTVGFTHNTLKDCTQLKIYVEQTDLTGTVLVDPNSSAGVLAYDDAIMSGMFCAATNAACDRFISNTEDTESQTLEDSYFYHAPDSTNSHTLYMNCDATVQDNVFEVTTTEPNILTSDNNKSCTVQRNLLIGAGALGNNVGAHTGTTWNILHNTLFLNARDQLNQGLWLSENGDLTGGTINVKSNLAGYGSSGNTYDDLFYDTSSGDNQVIDESSYNAFWNTAADPYDSDITVTTKNDYGDCTDPQFVDDTRNLATWGYTEHGTDGSASAAINLFLAKNGYNSTTKTQSDTPSGVTVAELIAWVVGGFKVQNLALNNAGHDGVTIGAMDYISSHAGTADVEIGAASGVAAVEFAVTSFTASFAATVGGAVVNASAAYGLPGRSASSSASIGGVIVDATAAYGIPDRSASSALTVGAAEVAGVTDFTPPNFSGTSALDVGNIAFDATGAVAGVVRSATIAVTIGGASLASTAVYVALSDLILVADGEVTQLTQVAVSPDYAVNYEKVQVGNTVRSEVVFRDASNSDSLIDPAAVYLDVQDPNENEGTYQYGIDAAVKRDGLGQYYADVLLNKHGYWYFRWYTSGSRPASKEIVVNAVEVETY